MAKADCSTDKNHPQQSRHENPAWPFKSTAKPLGYWDGAGAVDAQPSETLGSMEHAGNKGEKK